ncbi:hypothetical protein BJ322DRAFT_1214326 [Thelephora terrestris]|uniref:Uncharacterized protein n=1 Tax=Thelephora terrestris TaxID=56493 RepID=A0A9P6L2E1_9AGAM|nr:hypothetical protein BJ322DRAFT_1214326 [Thelephora terrestris]
MSWKDLQSMVEVQFLKFPEHRDFLRKGLCFDKDFKALTELESYTTFDDIHHWPVRLVVPQANCETLGKQIFLESTFIEGDPIWIYPYQDPIHTHITLAGRSTSIAGAQRVAVLEKKLDGDQVIQDTNNLVAKFYWLEQTQISKVDVTNDAAQTGNTNNLVKDHIHTIMGQTDPPCVMCLTSLIQVFLSGYGWGKGALGDHTHLSGGTQGPGQGTCFHCIFSPFLLSLGTLAEGNPAHGYQHRKPDVQSENKVGSVGEGGPSKKDNMKTLTFMALDLLKAFTWCLVYICICMSKDKDGNISVIDPYPLSSWHGSISSCSYSKMVEVEEGLKNTPLHKECKYLADSLHCYWIMWYCTAGDSNKGNLSTGGGLLGGLSAKSKMTARKKESYREPSDHESFIQVYQLLIDSSDRAIPVPDSKVDLLIELLTRVGEKYNL